MRRRRLLSISHSYCVALNRRLAHELADVGAESWEVTAVAPTVVHGNIRTVRFEPAADERCALEVVPAYLTRWPQLMIYGQRLRWILAQPWDLIHCWEEPYVLAGGQVASWAQRGVPLVFETARNTPKRYPPPFNWIERYAIARADGWVAHGQSAEQMLMRRAGYADTPHRAVGLGVDLGRFRPDREAGEAVRRRLGWDAVAEPVVGYLGRFVAAKGLPFLMEVLDRVDRPWRALFVGTGALEAQVRRWAAPRGDRVKVVTGVAHDQVGDYLNAMDLLCAPSETTPTWREMFGRMLIEAFACGVPVVANDSGEIANVIGDAGIVLPEGSETGWRQTLEMLLGDPARRASLGAAGLARARDVHSWRAVARRHLEFYETLLQRGKRVSG